MTGPLTDQLRRVSGGFGLGQVPVRNRPDATTRLTCGFCSTGCSLDVHLRDGRAVNLTPTFDHPVNLGMACPKGWEALTPLGADDRLTTPLRRTSAGTLAPIGWPEAISELVDRFKTTMDDHGPESVAFLSTGQIPTEEMALLGALFKFGMGGVHGDGNTRQCMATSVVAYKQAFGFDAPPYTYRDFEASDVIVLVGSNLAIAHPIMWERVVRNPNNPAIVVIDPRRTATAAAATHHLPLRPKSDLTLLHGLAAALIERGAVDHDFIEQHTSGFDAFADHVRAFDLDSTAEATGLTRDAIDDVAALIAAGNAVSFWWTMGVNQSHQAVRTAQAIINLALMTGNIGRPGTGPNSITGQCNAMGSRLFSNTTNLLGGHDFADPVARAKVAAVLGIDAARVPDRASLAYDEILRRVDDGSTRALWVIATNTAHSWIDQDAARSRLGAVDFLVVQDMYASSETVQLADLVLPAAGWGEKEGSFINSERRFGLTKRVAEAPGEALADFWIFKLVAEEWGCGDMFRQWSSPAATFELLRRLSAGQPCDFTGISNFEHIDRAGGIQWPYPDMGANAQSIEPKPETDAAERRLFADGRFPTPDGRARFIAEEPMAPPEAPSPEFPLVLLTGRGSTSQWHTNTRTEKSAALRALSPSDAYAELHPLDAQRRGIVNGQLITVRSTRGATTARAHLTGAVGVGHVFMAMHYGEVNRLTRAEFDPESRQPSYKHCAVEVSAASTRLTNPKESP